MEQDFYVKLVEAVEKRPCLYDYKVPEYTSKCSTRDAWEEISREVNQDVNLCREKWRNIRTVFSRFLKIKSTEGSKRRRSYYLNNKLQFLVPFLKPGLNPQKRIYTNQSVTPKEEPIMNMDDSGDVTIDEYELEGEFDPLLNEEQKFTTKPSVYNTHEGESEIDEIHFCKCQSNTEKEDSRRAYLISLLPDVKSLTDIEMRIFKRKTLEIIDDIFNSRNASSSKS